METINAVNFEDLFDFSPEPVDRLSHDDRDFQPSPLPIPPTQAPPNSLYSSSASGTLFFLFYLSLYISLYVKYCVWYNGDYFYTNNSEYQIIYKHGE